MADTDASSKRQYILFVEFSDGYTFRNLIEYLKGTNTSGNLVFTPDRITYSRPDSMMNILNEFFILKCNLSYYKYNTDAEEIVLGVKMIDIRSITKSIGRKDSVHLYMYKDDPLLYLKIVSSNTKMMSKNNVSIVRPQTVDRLVYVLPNYLRDEEDPTCTASVTDFCRMCTGMNSIKCNYITIQGYSNRIFFKGIIEGEIAGRIDNFGEEDLMDAGGKILEEMKKQGSSKRSSMGDFERGREDASSERPSSERPSGREDNCNVFKESSERDKEVKPQGKDDESKKRESSESDSYVEIKVKRDIIKNLAKLINLSGGQGVVRLYMEKGMPLKLICNIGAIGVLRIYLRDIKSSG